MDVSNYQNLGESGLKISKIIIGCMTFGSKKWANWIIEKEKALEILYNCYNAGLRTFDTADTYSNGVSEEILGEFIKKYNIPRENIVILSKCFFFVEESNPSFSIMDPGSTKKTAIDMINAQGLSRKHIFDAAEASVKRLGTYIDVLQIHRLDTTTPKKEIMKALNDVIEKGYTRYIGASSMKAAEFCELQYIAEMNGWTKFISMQNFYNLLYREEEREMIPFCHNNDLSKVTCIPWSPIAGGILAKTNEQRKGPKSARHSELESIFEMLGLNGNEGSDTEIVDRVEKVSKKHNVSMANIAIAWVLAKGCCPIVGINSLARVDDTIAAFKVKLTEDEIKYLEEPYTCKQVAGLFRE